jgi:hypothetical protein
MTNTLTNLKKVITNPGKPFTMIAKTKAILAILSLLLLGAGIYTITNPAGPLAAAKDPYTLDIQNRAQTIDNVVLGVIDAKKTEPAYKFRTTYEDAVFFIQKQNLETEQESLKLTPEQRALNVKYKAFLHEAYLVVDNCYNGKQADLTAMNTTKAALN